MLLRFYLNCSFPTCMHIPAHELEGAILQELKSFLTDDARLLDWLGSTKDGGP